MGNVQKGLTNSFNECCPKSTPQINDFCLADNLRNEVCSKASNKLSDVEDNNAYKL